ncbi:GNAT family N-acetyltransferase [Cytobacillus sp. IB215316]|uniref:GNAT family N-acetyltransferase n=1 Tax=Cytobacillus sp. IB215316 TaxID=3097354 RepID=UPI002A184EED|nr:GNAT family N-acetyltransferase [Cytobacillus sp. IB215316]MDX8360326.1 GNAT family N-acetyltransferase [Cytobacillus sp. IB215316]
MNTLQLISDYKNNSTYRESFIKLAKDVFGIDFQQWFDLGYWDDSYICYSFIDQKQVIANASINKMSITHKGKEFNAIQVGTVMTHPQYRNKGLAAKLMKHIIAKYENDCDFIYLFANDSVLDFYPKFGFNKVLENSFTIQRADLSLKPINPLTIKKLDVNKQSHLTIIERLASTRVPVSNTFGVKDCKHLLMFYIILAFKDATYYIEEEDSIIIFDQNDGVLNIYDIISNDKIDAVNILGNLMSDEKAIHFHFTPDFLQDLLKTELKSTIGNDTLFIRPLNKDFPSHFLFPLTSHA